MLQLLHARTTIQILDNILVQEIAKPLTIVQLYKSATLFGE